MNSIGFSSRGRHDGTGTRQGPQRGRISPKGACTRRVVAEHFRAGEFPGGVMSVSLRFAQLAIAIVGLAFGFEVSPAWSQAKEPPSCAAVSFRPVLPDATDGEHDAGVYKSRFGRIVVKGVVRGGRAENHYVTVNNNRP